jgi:hypothetical protein
VVTYSTLLVQIMTGVPLFQSMPSGKAPQWVWQQVSMGTAGHPGGV